MNFSEFFKSLYRSDPIYCYIIGGALAAGILMLIATFRILL